MPYPSRKSIQEYQASRYPSLSRPETVVKNSVEIINFMKKPTKKKKVVRMYAVVGKYGLYTGVRYARREVIKEHTADFGQTWEERKKKGDKAIKVTITYEL